jgi:hypothetical protein
VILVILQVFRLQGLSIDVDMPNDRIGLQMLILHMLDDAVQGGHSRRGDINFALIYE